MILIKHQKIYYFGYYAGHNFLSIEFSRKSATKDNQQQHHFLPSYLVTNKIIRTPLHIFVNQGHLSTQAGSNYKGSFQPSQLTAARINFRVI